MPAALIREAKNVHLDRACAAGTTHLKTTNHRIGSPPRFLREGFCSQVVDRGDHFRLFFISCAKRLMYSLVFLFFRAMAIHSSGTWSESPIRLSAFRR